MITPIVSLLGKLTYSKTHWLLVLCWGRGGEGQGETGAAAGTSVQDRGSQETLFLYILSQLPAD